eukprot:g3919.t1
MVADRTLSFGAAALCVLILASWFPTTAHSEGSVVKEEGEEVLPIPRDARRVDEPAVLSAADFALSELRKLSDSGVYTSLSLQRIVKAEFSSGVYHDNYHLQLELGSPHFKGGADLSAHDVMVMKSREDGVMSFAIDNFPVMDEAAIESYWRDMVRRHSKMREERFAALEEEQLLAEAQEFARLAAEGDAQVPPSLDAERASIAEMRDADLAKLEAMPVADLPSPTAIPPYRATLVANELDRRFAERQQEEEARYDAHVEALSRKLQGKPVF